MRKCHLVKLVKSLLELGILQQVQLQVLHLVIDASSAVMPPPRVDFLNFGDCMLFTIR